MAAFSSFNLYLRPFSSDRITVANPLRSGNILTPSNHLESLKIPLSALLTRLSATTPLIQVGGSGENPGPGKIVVQNDGWKDRVQLLAENAAAIVVAAMYSGATAWEVELLSSRGFLDRTTFVVPAKANLDSRQAASCAQMIEFFRELALPMPAPSENAIIFWYEHWLRSSPMVCCEMKKSNLRERLRPRR